MLAAPIVGAVRRIFGTRYEISFVLITGSIVLLVAILVGNGMGNRVLGQIANRASSSTTPVPIPTPSADDVSKADQINRRHEVLSVATDPGFPDPRVTPEPPPPATPRPTPKPTPTPTYNDGSEATPNDSDPNRYTSPPLPMPIASHEPDETSSPDGETSPRPGETAAPRPPRGYPSLPPGAPPTP